MDQLAEVIPLPTGVDPKAFRAILTAYVASYRATNKLPTSDVVHQHWGRISVEAIGLIMLTPEFRAGLLYQGIDPGDYPGLSTQQHAALLKMSDPLDKRGAGEKIKELGITPVQWSNWKKFPPFMRALEEQTRAAYREYAPEVRTRMIGLAESGDAKAMKFVLEQNGEGENSRAVADAREVILVVMQSVQKWAPPDVRQHILEDLQMHMTTLQLTR